jgi:hypothetical protein
MPRANQTIAAVVAGATDDMYSRVGLRREIVMNSAGDRLPSELHQLLQREGTTLGVHQLDIDVLGFTLIEVAGHVALLDVAAAAKAAE